MIHAVTRQAEVIHGAELQHSRIGRTVRHVTRYAAVGLDGCMFEGKRTLLIGVTLETRSVSTNRQSCLFQFETTVGIVAVTASHGSLKNLVMGRHGELMFDFGMTIKAKLRFTDSQQLDRREVRLL
jgi:hypothetical protein